MGLPGTTATAIATQYFDVASGSTRIGQLGFSFSNVSQKCEGIISLTKEIDMV